ncbi:MAG: thioester reductase domain-containing protein [Rhodobacteraceae bacterium]|nr:thioester reductase domain-containing protein [Paracoccaceae bacterium]
MKQQAILEPNDLRLRKSDVSFDDRFSARRSVAIPPATQLSADEVTRLCVVVLFEMQYRLDMFQPVVLLDGAAAEVQVWTTIPEGFQDCSVRESAHKLGSGAAEFSPDAVTLHILPEIVSTLPALNGLTIGCCLTGEAVSLVVQAPRGWGRTIDPHAEIEAHAETLAALLTQFLADPDTLPGMASSVTPTHRQFVLGHLAGRNANFGPFESVPQMLHECVAKFSDRTAYRFQDETLSFRQFERLANGVAQSLIKAGLKKGDIVPVMFTSGFEMPLSYYALMKCGAALVPVDFEWPDDRLHRTLGQFTSGMILSSQDVSLPDEFRSKQIILRMADITPTDDTVAVPVEPQDLIYGFFTSGTTGLPKCALNNHGAISNRFFAMSRFLGDIGGPVLQNTRYMYDSSIGHMFLALTQGYEITIPEERRALDLQYTIDIIAKHRIAMTDFVPSVFNQMIALVERSPEAQAKLQSLRELIIGGEKITPKMVQKMRAYLSPQLRISNCYGITETAIGLTYHPVTDDDGMHIPLGRPLDNCYLAIVDDQMRPLPRGAVGQIVVGGVCVGSGYMNNPERTQKVFLTNPFPEIPGDRLYVAGDRGYFDGNGELEFLGRRDFQVKIGGVLVEPAEIEAVASLMPQVHQSKAFVFTEGEQKTLALIATGETGLESSALLEHLRAELPRSSVPRHVVVLPAMPLADSGKLDQRVLQDVLSRHLKEQRRSSDSAEAPIHAAEASEAALRVLGILKSAIAGRRLGINEDFFEAGADSLQAVHAALEIEEAFGVVFGTSELLQHPTAVRAAQRIKDLVALGDRPKTPSERVMQDLVTLSAHLPACFAPIEQRPPRTILLTGATGFVGGHLMQELVSQEGLKVIALCRGGHNRLVESLKVKGLWQPKFATRLEVVAGDLSSPLIGLDDDTFSRLASECESIIHCAAMVNFVFDYQAHRPANVLGTHALLEFAARTRSKAFHYISTMGVLGGHTNASTPLAPEAIDIDSAILPPGGYSQSKLAAERLVRDAQRRGLNCTIYRLGEIMPAASGGSPNDRALTHMLLTAFATLRAVPDVAMNFDWTTADLAVKQILHSVVRPENWGRIYHVLAPESVCLTNILAEAGFRTERLTPSAWLQRLDARIADYPTRDLMVLRNMLPAHPDPDKLEQAFDQMLTDNPRHFAASDLTGTALAEAASYTDRSLRRYAAYVTGLAQKTSQTPPRYDERGLTSECNSVYG